jgi:hypothetical protein
LPVGFPKQKAGVFHRKVNGEVKRKNANQKIMLLIDSQSFLGSPAQVTKFPIDHQKKF